MHYNYINALSFLALTGCALALPAPNQPQAVHVVYEQAVETEVVYVYEQEPAATPAPHGYKHKHNPPTNYEPAPPAPLAPAPVVPAYSAAPPPAPSPTGSTDAPKPPPSDSTGYMSIVDEYRKKLGLKELKQDATLEANALKTVQDNTRSGTVNMNHQLNDGSFAQVLAPGDADAFKHCFVGGWLCEIPTLPGLNGECSTESQGWMYTSTGHADILTSGSYSKIGCANAGGLWGCDLA